MGLYSRGSGGLFILDTIPRPRVSGCNPAPRTWDGCHGDGKGLGSPAVGEPWLLGWKAGGAGFRCRVRVNRR